MSGINVIDIAQNTPEWLEFRRSHIGASDCAPVMGESIWRSPRQIWLDKLGIAQNRMNEAMERGKRLEEEARIRYNNDCGTFFEPLVGVSQERPWQMASFDGIYDNQILEIKCPGEKTMEKVKQGHIPEEYVWQAAHQLSVLEEANQVFFCFFDGTVNYVIPIYRESMIGRIDRLNATEKEFYEKYMIGFEEPPLHPKLDMQRIETDEWFQAANNWTKAKVALKQAELSEKKFRENLIELAPKDQKAHGFGVSVQKCIRKGTVNYDSIPELKAIDLSAYRKPSSEYWRIVEEIEKIS